MGQKVRIMVQICTASVPLLWIMVQIVDRQYKCFGPVLLRTRTGTKFCTEVCSRFGTKDGILAKPNFKTLSIPSVG